MLELFRDIARKIISNNNVVALGKKDEENKND